MDTLRRISTGDEGALNELLKETWGPLVRYLSNLLPSLDQASDAAQEAFVRLWAGRDRWTPGSARGLVFRLGRNAALDMIRKEQVRTRWARKQAREGARLMASPEDDLLASEFDGRFKDAMAELPERRREVFELVRFRGLSYAEAASTMGLSHQTVANQMTLAHKDLRRFLADLLSESMTARVGQPGRRSGDG